MKERNSESPQLKPGAQREGKASSVIQSEYVTEGPKWRVPEEGKDVPGKRMQQRWEAQWQEFLKTLQSPYSAWGNLQLSERTPWDDTKAFLASFEQVAEACRWPRGEWVVRLLPALSGEAEQAFQNMVSADKEDYGKVKAAILRADALRTELQRQHFRQFCYQEVEDPRRIHSQLQELCHRWLKPERHSKEQILELLILEQFLASLPPDLQGWIRAGGPDTCSQAVSLVEEFMMTRQEAESAKWQGPSQDVSIGSLQAGEVTSDATQEQIYEEAKQVDDAAITLLGSGIKCPSHSISLLPPEGQEVTEAGPGEGLLSIKETGVSLHMVERTLNQPGQQTMFWQVLQEDSGNVQPLGDGKAAPLKVENPQHGGEELEQTSRAVPLINQGKVPLTAEMAEQRCDGKRGWNKMETSQQVESLPENTDRVLAEASQWNFPTTSNTQEMRCPHRCRDTKKPAEMERKCTKLTESLTEADNKTSIVPMEVGKTLFSKHGSKSLNVSDLVVMHTGKNHCECSISGEGFETICCLNKPQGIVTREKPHILSKCEESLPWRDDFIHLNPGKKNSECPEDEERSVRHKQTLQKYHNAHTGSKRHECSTCEKGFTSRAELTRHQRIHTGHKPYECPQCGKRFSQRVNLMRHQRTHTGEKPYQCSQCEKCFTQGGHLKKHQRIHTGEKPYECFECQKCFRRKEHLIGHQKTHTGEYRLKCLECGRGFSRRSAMTRHRRTHSEPKSYERLKCGKSFS